MNNTHTSSANDSGLRSRTTWLALFVALGAAGTLAAALWVQHLGNPPCPLCILQRMGYLAVLAFALITSAARLGKSPGIGRGTAALGVLSGLLGLAAAAKHVWLVWHPGQTCGLDPLAVTINHWPITHWAPWMFRADGFCADVPYVFGIALPLWSALGFIVLTALLLPALRAPASH
ncbi:MAG: disulfide bond formation protein B [Proteobacteria bacterium]|nr:disulfide bond formation protein B [Pseudomonadota bacterium]